MVLVPVSRSLKASRRGQSKLSGKPEKANLYDIQQVLHSADNRTGWRRFPKSIQQIFRVTSKTLHSDQNKTCKTSTDSSVGFFRVVPRKRNLAFDLVGIELNPGPKNGKKKVSSAVVVKLPPKMKPAKKTKKISNSSNSQTYSASAAAYLRTVLAPCSGNARIPDMNCLPTSLVTLHQEFSATANSSGIGGLLLDVSTIPTYTLENSATTADSAFTYGSATQLTGVTSFVASFAYVRPVSACLEITYTGASNTDSGIIAGWTLGTFSGGNVESIGTANLTNAQACRSNQTNRLKDGIGLFYRPTDSSCFDFRVTSSNSTYNKLGIHISGAAANAAVYCKITLNYECVPALDTLSFANSISDAVKPPPVDPVGHAKAVEYVTQQRPFTSYEQAQRATQSMLQTANNFKGVIDVARSIFGIFMKEGPKLLL